MEQAMTKAITNTEQIIVPSPVFFHFLNFQKKWFRLGRRFACFPW